MYEGALLHYEPQDMMFLSAVFIMCGQNVADDKSCFLFCEFKFSYLNIYRFTMIRSIHYKNQIFLLRICKSQRAKPGSDPEKTLGMGYLNV